MIDPLRRVTGLSVDEFATAYWGVAPLLRRAAQLPDGDFTSLLSRDAVDELLSRRGLRTPFVRMMRDGEVVSPGRYTGGGGAGAEIADQAADERVLAEFAAGSTLVLQGLHRLWPPIQEFTVALAAQLGHPAQVNAYVTPPQSRGLAPHYDVHDVFVLQFAGRKAWRVHEPVVPSPLRSQPWNERKAAVAARAAEAPLLDVTLEPGDMLYLPRGYLHAAASLGEISGHLTVGVHPITRAVLADAVTAALAADPAMRRSLPAGVDLADEGVLDDELTAVIAGMRAALDRVDRAAVARAVGRRLAAATRPAPIRPLAQFALAAALAPETRVRLRPGLRVAYRTEGDAFVLVLADATLRFAAADADAVRAATTGTAVAANTLPRPDVKDNVNLLSRLLGAGIVVPA